MTKFLLKFGRSESGATLIEYGIALVIAIMVGGTSLTILGQEASLNMVEAESELYTATN